MKNTGLLYLQLTMLNVKSSNHFLSPDQNLPMFLDFGDWELAGTEIFEFYCERYTRARIHVVWAILR